MLSEDNGVLYCRQTRTLLCDTRAGLECAKTWLLDEYHRRVNAKQPLPPLCLLLGWILETARGRTEHSTQ